MKQYERFFICVLLLVLLILIGWFIDNKIKAERYKFWPSNLIVGGYILDTKTDRLYSVRGNKIQDLGAIGILRASNIMDTLANGSSRF